MAGGRRREFRVRLSNRKQIGAGLGLHEPGKQRSKHLGAFKFQSWRNIRLPNARSHSEMAGGKADWHAEGTHDSLINSQVDQESFAQIFGCNRPYQRAAAWQFAFLDFLSNRGKYRGE